MEGTNQTLYIKNLNDKVNKNETKRLLYHLFCSYGYILEIQTAKTGKLRGQAFVVFQSQDSAALALRELQGFIFLQKPLQISYSNSESHIIQKIQGTFQYKKITRVQNVPQAPKIAPVSEKKILKVAGLHPDLTQESLEKLFSQYFGLEEITLKENFALIKYSTHRSASLALAGLTGFKISKDYELKISFN
jgi:U2 small nuclear ribonucleoprotein B''